MRTKTLLASMAVASFAAAQPVAAATRSADSLPQSGVQSTESADRIGSISGEAEDVRGRPIVAILLVAGVLAALILILSGSKSPG